MSLYKGQDTVVPLPPPAWKDGHDHDQPAATTITKEPLVIDGAEIGFVLRNVLTQAECDHFISVAEDVGLLDVSNHSKYRNMRRVVAGSAEVAVKIFDRLRPHMAGSIQVDKGTRSVHQDPLGASHGRWVPYGISERWRLCKYDAGGHFSPHYDGDYRLSSSDKSLQTVMLYLNDGYRGGRTNFVDERQGLHKDGEGRLCASGEHLLHRLQPEPGMALVFNHRVMHEGASLLAGSPPKYMMRSEVMFRNVEPAGGALTAKDEAALALVQDADHHESNGEVALATACWRKAFKLSPAIEAHFNGGGTLA